MISQEEIDKIIKGLKSKYPKLKFDSYLEDISDKGLGYAYTIYVDYKINSVLTVESAIYLYSSDYNNSSTYEANNKAEIKYEKPYIFPDSDGFNVTEAFFKEVGTKGVEAIQLINDCTKYFNSTYKKDILRKLKD